MTVVTAMGQMFYSLSIAMGILITFGSYMKKDISIEESTKNVEIFDTAVAIMAGLMIIPAVFAFSGDDSNTLSVRAIELVTAANNTSRKNNMPTKVPSPILSKTFGMVMNIRDGIERDQRF